MTINPDRLSPEIRRLVNLLPPVQRPEVIQQQLLPRPAEGKRGVLFAEPIGATPVTRLLILLRESRAFRSIFMIAHDPDSFHRECVDGEQLHDQSGSWIYRPWRHFMELAELAGCYLHLPLRRGNLVLLHFEVVEEGKSWRQELNRGREKSASEYDAKYGSTSHYSRFNRFEEPWVADEMLHAVDRARLRPGDRVLSLGVNSGKELALFRQVESGIRFEELQFTGIDIAASAIAEAQASFPEENCRFLATDLQQIDQLQLPPQNLIMAISVLQSSSLQRDNLLSYLVQKIAADRCTFMIGFPDSRYSRHRLMQGAATRHNTRPDYTTLVKEMRYFIRYFTSHRYRVTLGGRYYLIMTASSI